MKPIVTSFVGGEVTPDLIGRVDLAKYTTFLGLCKNCVVLPYGGIINRVGTFYVAEAKYHDKKFRLVDFRFSTEQAYSLEIGHLYIRFFMEGGQIQLSGSPYEISTLYTEDDLVNMSFTQSIDTLFICCKGHPVRMLTRSSHTSWSIADVPFNPCPLDKENTTSTTITVSGASMLEGATVTMTASSAVFESGHVGTHFGIRNIAGSNSYTYTAPSGSFTTPSYKINGSWTITITAEAGGIDAAPVFVERSLDEGLTWTKLKTINKRSGALSLQITGEETYPALYRLRRADAVVDVFDVSIDVAGREVWTYFKIESTTSDTTATATLLSDFDYAGTAFETWAEGAWSEKNGYPETAAFFDDRLFFGQNTSNPFRFWGSDTSNYYTFSSEIPIASDNSLQYDITSREVNAIRHFVPLSDLITLTSGAEWKISAGSKSDAIAPDSIKVLPQTYFGSSNIEPIVSGNTILFVQELGSKVRDLAYTFESDSYNGKDVSVLASHIMEESNITDWSYQEYPGNVIWCVMSDGNLAGITYIKEHDIIAWHRHNTDGVFITTCSIPNMTLGIHDTYFGVRRTINGQQKQYIECMSKRYDNSIPDSNLLDSYVEITNPVASATFGGLGHLEGKSVSVITSDGYVGDFTVNSGSINIGKAKTFARVGLKFTSEFSNMGIEVQNGSGTLQGTTRRNGPIQFIVRNCAAFEAGPNADRCIEVKIDDNELFDGYVKFVPEGGWDTYGSVYVKQENPLPMKILGMMPEIQVGG